MYFSDFSHINFILIQKMLEHSHLTGHLIVLCLLYTCSLPKRVSDLQGQMLQKGQGEEHLGKGPCCADWNKSVLPCALSVWREDSQ